MINSAAARRRQSCRRRRPSRYVGIARRLPHRVRPPGRPRPSCRPCLPCSAMALFGIMAWMREKTHDCPLCVEELRASRQRKLSSPAPRRTSTGVSPASARAASLCERHRRLRKRSVPTMVERRRGSDGRSSRHSRSRQDSEGADEASEGRSSDDGWLDRRGRCLSDAEKWQDVERWRELSQTCSSLPRDTRRQRRASHIPRGSPRPAALAAAPVAAPSGGENRGPAPRRLAGERGSRGSSGSPALVRAEDQTRGDSPPWYQTSSAASTASAASAAGEDSVYELNAAIAAEYNRVFAGTFGAARSPAPPQLPPQLPQQQQQQQQQQQVKRRDPGARRTSRSQRQARSVSVPCRPSSRYEDDGDAYGGFSLPSCGDDALVLANGPVLLAAIDDDPLCTCECTCEYAPLEEFGGGVWPPAALAVEELQRLEELTLGEPTVGERLALGGLANGVADRLTDGRGSRRSCVGPRLVPSPGHRPRSEVIARSPDLVRGERRGEKGESDESSPPAGPASCPVPLAEG